MKESEEENLNEIEEIKENEEFVELTEEEEQDLTGGASRSNTKIKFVSVQGAARNGINIDISELNVKPKAVMRQTITDSDVLVSYSYPNLTIKLKPGVRLHSFMSDFVFGGINANLNLRVAVNFNDVTNNSVISSDSKAKITYT